MNWTMLLSSKSFFSQVFVNSFIKHLNLCYRFSVPCMLAGDAGDVQDVSSSDDNSKERTIDKATLVKSIQSCAIHVPPFTVCWVFTSRVLVIVHV